jgi:hypothetical protein
VSARPKLSKAERNRISQPRAMEAWCRIREERRSKGLCVYCGNPAPSKDEKKALRRKAILERKLAAIQEELRRLSVKPAPKPAPAVRDTDDVPIGKLAREGR